MEKPIEKYKQLKHKVHVASIIAEESLLKEIEDFGKDKENKKLYKKLKKKFYWHRRLLKECYPIGVPPAEWSSSQTPMVSVIVPNYCHASYLKERIDCILNQTFRNFELILLDDCSTDNSSEILLSYKNNPLVSHVIINEHNSGNTFLQWEKGVSLAKGKYIWIAESDDYADETFLDSMMSAFYMYPDCALVRSGSYMTNENGRIMFCNWDYWEEDMSIHYISGKEYIRRNMLRFNYIYNASMVVFRKDVFQQIDKVYQNLQYTGDWQCWIELLVRGPICEYRRKLNYFRQHSNKVSARSKQSNRGLADQFTVLSYVIDNVKMSLFRRIMLRGEMYDVFKKGFKDVSDETSMENSRKALEEKLKARPWHRRFYKTFMLLGFRRYLLRERRVPVMRAIS